MTPDIRTGIGSGFSADYFRSPRPPLILPESKLVYPPIPEDESATDRIGRRSEEKIGLVIAGLPDVLRVIRHPKYSIADWKKFDLSIDHTPESGKVPVHIQGKHSLEGLRFLMDGLWADLRRQGLRMTPDEYLISQRIIVIVSGSDQHILKYYNRGNEEIQERTRFERSRTQLVPVFTGAA